MTNTMLKELISAMKKRIKTLTIVCVILAIISACLLAFIALNYEISFEYEYEETMTEITEENEYQIEQDSENNGSNVAIIDSDIGKSNDVFYFCLIITIFVFLMVGGAIFIHGKAKNHR